MKFKSFLFGILMSAICFLVMIAFLFVSTGFAPGECLLTTASGHCSGVANILPYPLRLLVFLAVAVYSVVLGVKIGKSHYQEEMFEKKQKDWLADYRKKHKIKPISK